MVTGIFSGGSRVRFQAFSFGYNNGPEIISNFSLNIEHNEFVSFIGPSGCGKTSILRATGGLLPSRRNEIVIDGLTPAEARLGKYFGFVFQSPSLLPWLTALGNAKFVGIYLKNKAIQQKAERLFLAMGLTGAEDLYPSKLSGGMQARVAIVRALAHAPKVLLLDESFGSLDELTRMKIYEELSFLQEREQHDEKTAFPTVLMVTHSIQEAILLADRVVVLSKAPCRILGEYHVPFPRPRHSTIIDEPSFGALASRIRTLLY